MLFLVLYVALAVTSGQDEVVAVVISESLVASRIPAPNITNHEIIVVKESVENAAHFSSFCSGAASQSALPNSVYWQ